MKRAVTYARVSMGEWQERNKKLSYQLKTCRDFVLKKGWLIVAELSENERAAPGSSMNLPQLSLLMEMAKDNRFDVLVVTEMDRLSRRLVKQILIEEELSNRGILIEYVYEDYPETPDGKLNKLIKAVIAEYEQLKTRERIKRGKIAYVKAGNVLIGARAPYGYTKSMVEGHRSLIILNDEASIICLIYKWYTIGIAGSKPLSTPAIARKLSKLKIPAPNDTWNNAFNRGAEYGIWKHASVHNIISNETYAGIWRYGKRPRTRWGRKTLSDHSALIGVKVPAIIKRDQWLAATNQMNLNRCGRPPKYDYLLRTRLRCKGCGQKIYTCGSKPSKVRNSYYYCYKGKGRTCSNIRFYQLKSLDLVICNWLHKLLGDFSINRFQHQQQKNYFLKLAQDIRDIEHLHENFKLKMERLSGTYITEQFDADEINYQALCLTSTINGLNEEQVRMRSRLQILKADNQDHDNYIFPQRSANLERKMDFQSKRDLIKQYDVYGILDFINGLKIAYFTSQLGSVTFLLKGKNRRKNVPVVKEIDLQSVGLRIIPKTPPDDQRLNEPSSEPDQNAWAVKIISG